MITELCLNFFHRYMNSEIFVGVQGFETLRVDKIAQPQKFKKLFLKIKFLNIETMNVE